MNPTAAQTPGAFFGGKHAVVIGSSIAGLLAGRVLADHFDQVTIIERDALVDGPEARKGVPQGRHAHGLLDRGAQIMEGLFPGFFAELKADGALAMDMAATIRWYQYGTWKIKTHSGITVHIQSRPFLEWKLRRRVAALPNVRILDETDALHPLTTLDQSRITGVQIRRRGANPGEEALEADLVVDASGRGSRTPQWLTALGYGQVEENIIKIDVGYTSRIYRRPAHVPVDQVVVIFPKPPAESRVGMILPMEGDRWMVSLSGWLHDYPPTDEAGFLEYARSLPVPDVYEAMKDAEPLTPIVAHKIPSNQRRRYERMVRFPEGLVVLGDALCSFNPIYGQGMTTAALDVMELDRCLREQRRGHAPGDIRGLAQHFHRRASKIIDVPWMLATGEDFRFPQISGPRPLGQRLLHWYTARLHTVTGYDAGVLTQFLQVMHMLKSPLALFTPPMIWRVLTGRPTRQPAPATRPAAHPVHAAPAEAEPAA
jgi:2-polyprenyl-6-methoxyphenol hydroxylase-like FAD-dependent oxidoreductase